MNYIEFIPSLMLGILILTLLIMLFVTMEGIISKHSSKEKYSDTTLSVFLIFGFLSTALVIGHLTLKLLKFIF